MKLLCLAFRQPFSQEALAFALLIAKQLDAQVNLLYVAKREKGRARGEKFLRIGREQLKGLQIESRIEVGDALEQIRIEVDNKGIDMLILGSPKRAGLIGGSKNNVLRRLVNQSPISTAVVRHAPPRIERILICTAGMESSIPVIERGASLAKSLGSKATLLYVGGTVPSMYTGLAGVEEELSELLESNTPVAQCLRRGAEIIESYKVDGELKLRHGVVTEQILREADLGAYDLIVLGASRMGDDLKGLLLGDVTQEVIGGASCPVLVIKKTIDSAR